ncbi:hypothetical protein AN392_03441 [Pseudoalteromonas sp. P1-16-1b]|nr:hypothetical protein AN392_03441 [Pseudoalteromonas sp. P1-16-1b]
MPIKAKIVCNTRVNKAIKNRSGQKTASTGRANACLL